MGFNPLFLCVLQTNFFYAFYAARPAWEFHPQTGGGDRGKPADFV